jgi:hypothetical protein
MSNPFAGIGLGELGHEMSNSFRSKSEEEKKNSPLNLIGGYLIGKLKDSIKPPGTENTQGVNLNNEAYFKAHPVSSYGEIKSVAPNVVAQNPIAPPMSNKNMEENPASIHIAPIHLGPKTPDPAHLQIDSDWNQ